MKNRLLPEILFIFVVPFIIFDKEIPFKDWLFSSYHQLQLLNYFILIILFFIANTAACVLSETPIFLNMLDT